MITYSTYLGWIKALCRWISILARPQRLLIIKEKDETAQIEAVHKDPSSRKQTIQDDRGIEYHASVVSEVFFFLLRVSLNFEFTNPNHQLQHFEPLQPRSTALRNGRMFPKRWKLRVWWMLSPQRTGLGETRFFGSGERSFVFFGWLENCWFSKRI